MNRQTYPTDLSDAQWTFLSPLIPPAKPGGRRRSVDIREIVNAIFYLTKTGCQWRALPHDLPNWSTVHTYYRNWRRSGAWERIHDALREQVRVHEGRAAIPVPRSSTPKASRRRKKGGPRL